MIHRALPDKPAAWRTWSAQQMAGAQGVSKSTVQRWFSLFGVKLHLAETCELSGDPSCIEKVRDITGQYVHPPEHAIVPSADEKTQVQALDRTQPVLPMGPGYAEGYTHDYIRHGTTTLCAALDMATGQWIAPCRQRHRHQEWLAFLRLLDRETPDALAIHLVCDNYATHQRTKVRAWIATRPRVHLHFTPTYASWLNQVERWFGWLSQRAIQRATIRSVTELKQQIMAYTEQYNESPKPFVRVATSESIFERFEHLCKRINGT